jgi:hypothetical protein
MLNLIKNPAQAGFPPMESVKFKIEPLQGFPNTGEIYVQAAGSSVKMHPMAPPRGFYVDRNGNLTPSKRDQDHRPFGEMERLSAQVEVAMGPNTIKMDLTQKQNEVVFIQLADLMKETQRRERASKFQAWGSTVFALSGALLLLLGVYHGTKNSNYNEP